MEKRGRTYIYIYIYPYLSYHPPYLKYLPPSPRFQFFLRELGRDSEISTMLNSAQDAGI